jgi:membrane fusion protein
MPDRGVIRLVSPQAATVVESHAVEGGVVKRDDILFVLDVGLANVSGDARGAIQRSLASRENNLLNATKRHDELSEAKSSAIAAQILGLRRELESMAAEAALQNQRLQLAQEGQSRLEALRADNFISAAQVQNKNEEILGLKAQLQALERQRVARTRDIAALEAQRAELPLQRLAAQGEIDREMAVLAQQSAENEARHRVVIRAPQDGTVTAVLAEPGQSVGSSAALTSLLPAHAKLQAQLFAPSSSVGFVGANQTVFLRYQAFPYQKFGHQTGRVTQVSRSPLQASELAGLPFLSGADHEPLYRITVALDRQSVDAYGTTQALVPGMQLDADVNLDRRHLIEWIFEPILGIAGRL